MANGYASDGKKCERANMWAYRNHKVIDQLVGQPQTKAYIYTAVYKIHIKTKHTYVHI